MSRVRHELRLKGKILGYYAKWVFLYYIEGKVDYMSKTELN